MIGEMWTVFVILATCPFAAFMYLMVAVSVIVALVLTIRNQRKY